MGVLPPAQDVSGECTRTVCLVSEIAVSMHFLLTDIISSKYITTGEVFCHIACVANVLCKRCRETVVVSPLADLEILNNG